MGEAFITARGGGAGLNFKIVGGTTQPTSASENTIWVNTDTAITSWAFSATEPTSPTAGMVWISIGNQSTIPINAIKKNTLMVYPVGIQQYINGAWVNKIAQAYQGGEWKAMEKVIFDIDTATDTSDFTFTSSSNTLLNPTVSYSAGNYVSIYTPKGSDVTVYLVDDPDLTGYSTLTVTGYTSVEGGEKMIVATEGQRTLNSPASEASVVLGTTLADYTIDISAFSGKHAVGFYIRDVAGRYIYIKEIKLS